MTQGDSDPTLQRSSRKQDLLLASWLARGEAAGAFHELADRADAVAERVASIRAWLSNPWVAAACVTGALAIGVGLRRVRAVRVLRWGWLAWRLWRSAAPAVASAARLAGDGRPWPMQGAW